MDLSVKNKYVAIVGLATATILLIALAVRNSFLRIGNKTIPSSTSAGTSAPIYTIGGPDLKPALSIAIPLSSTVSEAFEIINDHINQTQHKKISAIAMSGTYSTISGLDKNANTTRFSDWSGAKADRKVNFSLCLEGA